MGAREDGGEEGRKERVVRRNERLARRERAHSARGEERSGFGEGKGKGPGKAPKQIRVPPLTDRKFVESRPRDSASRLSRRDRLSRSSIGGAIDRFVISRDIQDYSGGRTSVRDVFPRSLLNSFPD